MSFEVDMTFTLNDIDLQMTLTYQQALVEYKYIVIWIMKLYSFDMILDPITTGTQKLDLDIVKV